MDNSGAWKHVIFAAVALLLIGGATVVAGCNLGDMVTSKIPSGARSYLPGESVPANPSHNQSLELFEQFRTNVLLILDQWEGNLADSEARIGLVTAFGNNVVSELTGSPLAATPIGGLAIGGLGFLWGLFTRKPGTQKELDATYDAGRQDALKDFAKGAVAAVSGKPEGSA